MFNKVPLVLLIGFALAISYWFFFGLPDHYIDADVNLDLPTYPTAGPKPSLEVTDYSYTEDEPLESPENTLDSVKTARINPDITIDKEPRLPDQSNWPQGVPRPDDKGTLLSPSLRDLGDEWISNPEARTNFSMPLPDGREVEVEVKEFVAIGEDGGEFIGTIRNYPNSRVSLSYRGSAEAGIINLPSEGRTIQILPGVNGQFFFQETPFLDSENQVPPALDQQIPPPPDFIPPPPPIDLVIPEAPNDQS